MMALAFVYQASPTRVVFAPGNLSRPGAEAGRLNLERVLVVSTVQQNRYAEQAAAALGARLTGSFAGAAMHTPVEVTNEALALVRKTHADGLVAIGGRSVQFDDAVNIHFTSGTTGSPKGVTLTHDNILNNGYFVGRAMRLNAADRICIPVPLYHCFGMVMGNLAALTHGCAMVYPGEGFDPLATLETVQAERCTALYGVPTMFIAELDHPEFARFDLSTHVPESWQVLPARSK